MLRDFEHYLRRYVLAQLFGILVICLMLSLAAIRNTSDEPVWSLLAAAGMVVWAVSLGALRDVPGYWVYALLAPKLMLGASTLEELRHLRFNRWVSWLSPLQWPLIAPSLIAAMIVLSMWGALSLWADQRVLVTLLLVGCVFPLLLVVHLSGTSRYFLLLASPEGEALMQQTGAVKRRLASYRREDLLVTLSITFLLVWPLGSKPAFSVEAGYLQSDFVIAAIALGWIATFFMVLGARRSRLFAMVGERLSVLFLCQRPEVPLAISRLAGKGRVAVYAVLSAAWVLTLCSVFSLLATSIPFVWFSAALMPVLGWIFWTERGLTLAADFDQASQFISERAVAPVAVHRREFPGR